MEHGPFTSMISLWKDWQSLANPFAPRCRTGAKAGRTAVAQGRLGNRTQQLLHFLHGEGTRPENRQVMCIYDIISYYIISYYIISYYISYYIISYYIISYCIILYHIILHIILKTNMILYDTRRQYMMVYNIVWYYTELYGTIWNYMTILYNVVIWY